MGKLTNLIVRKSLKIDNGYVKMFNKIDYIFFPASSMAEFLQKIGEDFGEEYQFELGYKAGFDGSKEMVDNLGLLTKSVDINLRIILKMFETLGFGLFDKKIFNVPQNKVLFHLTQHPVIEYARKKFGKKSFICPHYRGIYSIHADKELKIKGCRFMETQCRCKGDDFCEWSHNVFKKKKTSKKR